MIGTRECLSSRAGDPVSGIRVPAGRAAHSAAACAAALAKFEQQVDPEGVLPPAEPRIRAEHARKEHLARISLRSAKVRKVRAELAQLQLEAAADIAELADDGDEFWQAGQQAKPRDVAGGGETS